MIAVYNDLAKVHENEEQYPFAVQYYEQIIDIQLKENHSFVYNMHQ
ncbi:unnamed protein product, partial [Didymodactylos carnosus]